jgi:hypothetical protein
MVVQVLNRVFGFNRNLPVMKLTITFATPTDPKFEYELSLKIDEPFSAPDLWQIQDWTPGEREDGPDNPPDGPTVEAIGGDLLIDHFDVDYAKAPVSSGQWTNGDGDISITLPAVRPVGKFLVIDMAWDGYHIPTGPYTNLAVGLWNDSDFWLPMNLAGTGERWVSPDFEHAVYYRRIVGDEGDTLSFTPNAYEEFGQTAESNWAAVAHVQDLSPHDVDTQYLEQVQSDSGNTWSGIGATVPADGHWRSLLNVLTNSTDLTNVPSDWVLVGTSEVFGEVQVYSFAKDWGFQTNGTDMTADPDWPDSSAFTNGIGYYHHFVKEASDALPPAYYVGGDDLVTPGPDVTEAPWAGGNPYRDSFYGGDPQNGLEVSDSVIVRDPILYLYLHDSAKWLAEVSWDTEDVVGNDVTWEDTYGDPPGGWSTRFWAKEAGFDDVVDEDGLDILVKWRYTGATPGSTTYLRAEWFGVSIPDDLDPEDIWLQHQIFYIGGNYDGIQSWLNTVDSERTQPTAGWASEAGTEWMWPYHAYGQTGDKLAIVEDQWYYTRIKVGAKTANGWGFPYYGSGPSTDMTALDLNLSGVKTWPANEDEPQSGGRTFEWYWNTPSYPPGDPPPVELNSMEHTAEDGWDYQLPAAWYKNYLAPGDPNVEYRSNTLELSGQGAGAGRFEIDAIWRYGGGTVLVPGITSDAVAEQPLFIEANTTLIPYYSTYETQYPYEPGTLKVYVGGTLQGNGMYGEQDPASGRFLVYHYGDQSASMYVTYTRTSSSENHASVGVYRPAPVLQYGWGSALDGYNCNMAAGCMALDRHTLGTKTSTPPIMRSYQFDQSGGTDLGDLATAWSNGYGETFEWGIYSWAQFLSNIRGGRGAVLQGLYGNLPSDKRFSSTFTGGHSIFVNEELNTGYFRGQDPLTAAAVVYTEAELKSYAEGLSWVSANQASVGFTQVTS